MNLFNKLRIKFKDIFVRSKRNEPWLAYYSREERSIEFTKETIYNYMKNNVGDDTDLYALNYFDNRITYKEFFKNIDVCARGLREYGVKEGDVVTICLPNMPEAIYVFYACNKIGAVADIIHPLSSAEELKLYLNESKSRFLFLVDFDYEKFSDVIDNSLLYKTILVSPSESMKIVLKTGYNLLKGLKVKRPKKKAHNYMTWSQFYVMGAENKDDFAADMKSTDLALILHSGGTTGKPKGIMISNYNFNAIAQQSGVNVIDVRPKDKILTILPIFHGFGLGICVHTPLCLKAVSYNS